MTTSALRPAPPAGTTDLAAGPAGAPAREAELLARIGALETRLRKREEQRRAMLHIMSDLHEANRRLNDQRRAMLHIMSDLHETTAAVRRREQELRDKQEQLVQAGKLATLGQLTMGVAHELNNPLNNIGLFVGNAIDQIESGVSDAARTLKELRSAMQQVSKATEIVSHLRTFGRAALVTREQVPVKSVLERSLALLEGQLRLRQVEVRLDLCAVEPVVMGNAIQLEQVCLNVLMNARDAVADAPRKAVRIGCAVGQGLVELTFRDSGTGIPPGLEQRIFDPFFTTKEVGAGTGLGLSIAYAIIKEHKGSIRAMNNHPDPGATFVIQLPLADREPGAGAS
jgi:C4-dicarboxylate-specific signal transduction histidine kinase